MISGSRCWFRRVWPCWIRSWSMRWMLLCATESRSWSKTCSWRSWRSYVDIDKNRHWHLFKKKKNPISNTPKLHRICACACVCARTNHARACACACSCARAAHACGRRVRGRGGGWVRRHAREQNKKPHLEFFFPSPATFPLVAWQVCVVQSWGKTCGPKHNSFYNVSTGAIQVKMASLWKPGLPVALDIVWEQYTHVGDKTGKVSERMFPVLYWKNHSQKLPVRDILSMTQPVIGQAFSLPSRLDNM